MKVYLKKNIKVGDKEFYKDSFGYTRAVTWGDKTNGSFVYLVDFEDSPMTPVSLSNLSFSASPL
jgi:hypothetical protein